MQFEYPATTIYAADGSYRVVWSVEEYEQCLRSGYTAEKPEPEVKPKRGRSQSEE